MQAELKNFIESKKISGSLREVIESLDEQSASALSLLLEGLEPSANTLREYLRLSEEIALRDEKPLHVVLSEPSLLEISRQKGNRKDRQRDARDWLERCRYPELTRIHQTLEQCQKEVAKDLGIRVELPQGLEGDSISISISAREAEDFRALGQKCIELEKHPAVRKIFAVLRGEG